MSSGPSEEDLYTRSLESAIKVVFSLIDFLEVQTEVEVKNGIKLQDFGKMLSSESFVNYLTSKIGPEAVDKVNLFASRFSQLNQIVQEPPEERLRQLQELMKSSRDLKEMVDRSLNASQSRGEFGSP